ncbi:MAG TPA: hypothetical protein VGW57_15500 [Chthoniobacterales bacterium]|nr:hypothetical protein [Chthoniobacterales bacterium]
MTDALERRPDAYSVAVIIKCVCAWCSRVLRDGIEPVTHGICDNCICELCGITPEELSERRREFEEEEQQ